MNTLTIDIGNSYTKFEIWNKEGFLTRLEFKEFTLEKLVERISEKEVEGIIVSSVRKDTDKFIESLDKLTECRVINFNSEEIKRYSANIDYEGNIGPDRIAAFLGAKSLFGDRPMLIVDMGTAMTLDISDGKGIFRGGNISAGFKTRIKSLNVSTSMLPEIEYDHKYISFGNNTFTSIESGAINGVIGEIRFAQIRAQKEYEGDDTLLTGGDSDWFHILLTKFGIKTYHDSHLVGRGLNFHLREILGVN